MQKFVRSMIRTVVFCGLLAGGGISVSAADGEPFAYPAAQDGPRLFASEQTRKALGGMAPYVPRWAGMDVLVVTAVDLNDTEMKRSRSVMEAFDRFAASIDGFPFERLEREGLKKDLAIDAVSARAHGFPMPARKPGEKPVCAISLPDLPRIEPRQWVTPISGISGENADFLPGGAADWALITVAHELAHCAHSYDDRSHAVGLQFEREADQHAINIYRAHARDLLGPISDINAVPRALIALRGIQLDAGYGYHATSAGLSLDGSEATETDGRTLAAAKQKALNAIRSMARSGIPDRTRKSWSASPQQTYRAAKTLYDQGFFDQTPLQKRYVEAFLLGAESLFPSYFGVTSSRVQEAASATGSGY